MADSLSTKIDALISGADALSAAADSVATITSGSDVLVSNFDHVEEVFDNLQLFLSELKTNSWYAPVGLISPFGGLTAPTGWLLCDGSAVSQTTYSALHTVLGANAYGTDSGGNFYLPDLRGRTVAGVDNMGGTDAGRLDWANTLGTAGGAQTLPAHTHSWSTTGGNHTSHEYSRPYFGGVDNTYVGGAGTNSFVVSQSGGWSYGGWVTAGVGGSGSHSHSGTTDPTGTGSHGVMQPTMLLNYIIKW